jgi:glutamine synthetase adenylyltransferase
MCRLAQDQSDAGSETDIIRNLRIARNRMALLVAMADIAGAWDCQTVTAALTRFADTSLQAATGFVFAQAAQGPRFDLGEGHRSAIRLRDNRHGQAWRGRVELLLRHRPDRLV